MVTATAENRGMTYFFSCAITILCQFSCKRTFTERLISPQAMHKKMCKKMIVTGNLLKNKIFKAMLQYKLHVLYFQIPRVF